MIFSLFALGIAALFFIASLILLSYGRRLGLRYLVEARPDMAGLRTIEGAVFALVGLLVAFTISGALQRFDDRRLLVAQEANAISTAYDRLALLEENVARSLRAKLKDYTQARIDLYRMPHDFALWGSTEVWSGEQQDKILQRKTEIWDQAGAACAPGNYPPACTLVLLALSNVFEVARLRAAAAEKHPPQAIYVMLFALGLGGSLLAGFSMASAKARSSIHMVIFAGALAVTLYVITDMEYPRLGLIRIDGFDHFLTDVHDHMR